MDTTVLVMVIVALIAFIIGMLVGVSMARPRYTYPEGHRYWHE
jgi:ABC-type dipeptide/oligopeptide/nickel transport system permease component